MPFLITKPKPHAAAMARSSAATRCKKHPKHNQSPGVCSLCLSQRLSQLANAGCSSSATLGSSSSSSSSVSSSSSSSCSSPLCRRKSSISMSSLFKRRTNFLTSTRSLASRFYDHGDDRKKKKYDGFWSKLIITRRGKEIVEETLRRSASATDQTIVTAS